MNGAAVAATLTQCAKTGGKESGRKDRRTLYGKGNVQADERRTNRLTGAWVRIMTRDTIRKGLAICRADQRRRHECFGCELKGGCARKRKKREKARERPEKYAKRSRGRTRAPRPEGKKRKQKSKVRKNQ